MTEPQETSQYFAAAPAVTSATETVRVRFVTPPLLLRTDRGVFSHGRVDTGTEVLLRQGPRPDPAGTYLDLGCGAGVIALTLARRAPDSRVVAVDVNERARALCAANAADNGLGNVEVLAPEAVDPAVRFDAIWSNPPIRVGKAALHELLLTWLDRLTTDGTAHLVVHKNLGSDSLQRWLTDAGWPTTRLLSAKGYRVLDVTRP
jgi:16S rRNA (guanine1207-N2)-methyltransferase